MKILKVVKKFIEVYLLFYFIIFTGFRYQLSDVSILQINVILILVLLSIWLVFLLVERETPGLPPYPGVFIVFGISYLTSVIHSVDISRSIPEALLFTGAVLLFIGIISVIKYGRDRKSLIDSLLWVGLIYNVLKIPQVIGNWGPVSCGSKYVVIPNKSAGFIGLLIILSLSVVLSADYDYKKKWLPSLTLATSAGLLFVSGSRGGYVGAVAGVAVVLLIHIVHTGKFTYKGIAGVLFGLVLFPVVGSYLLRPPACTKAWTTSITDRVVYSVTALDIIKEYPVLGAGPGTYKLFTGVDHAHSIYVNMFVERGAVGVIASGLVLLTLLRVLTERDRDILSKMIGLGALTAFLIHGIVDVTTFEPFVMRYLFAIVAVVVGPISLNQEKIE